MPLVGAQTESFSWRACDQSVGGFAVCTDVQTNRGVALQGEIASRVQTPAQGCSDRRVALMDLARAFGALQGHDVGIVFSRCYRSTDFDRLQSTDDLFCYPTLLDNRFDDLRDQASLHATSWRSPHARIGKQFSLR